MPAEKMYHHPAPRAGRGHVPARRWSTDPMPLRLLALALFCHAVPVSALFAPVQPARPAGWQLPLDADELKNPVAGDAHAIAAGQALFAQHCRRCHGPAGEGDGPDAHPEDRAAMNLTDPKRAARNPDGVVFHKILNGRGRPEMPAFRDDLTTEQIWAVVAYVQSLRKAPAAFR